MKNKFQYYNTEYGNDSPNNTCLTNIKKIRINQLVKNKDDDNDTEIIFYNKYDLKDVQRCVRFGLLKKNEDELLGSDINNNIVYGYIPLTEFNISFDYEIN